MASRRDRVFGDVEKLFHCCLCGCCWKAFMKRRVTLEIHQIPQVHCILLKRRRLFKTLLFISFFDSRSHHGHDEHRWCAALRCKCSALTAATMYLIWSLFSNRRLDFGSDSDEDEYDDQDDVTNGYAAIPAARIEVPSTAEEVEAMK